MVVSWLDNMSLISRALRRGCCQQAGRLGNTSQTMFKRSITDETRGWVKMLNEPLSTTDPDLKKIIDQEKVRQQESLVLIASENFTSR